MGSYYILKILEGFEILSYFGILRGFENYRVIES